MALDFLFFVLIGISAHILADFVNYSISRVSNLLFQVNMSPNLSSAAHNHNKLMYEKVKFYDSKGLTDANNQDFSYQLVYLKNIK